MSARRADDAGFTLVELLIAIVLSGIVAGVTVAAMATSLNVASSTAAAVADSTDAGLISTFLSRDAQSAGAGGVSTSAGPGGAGGSGWADCEQGGAFVVGFGWSDPRPPSPPTVVTYALDGAHQLTRRTCADGTESDVVVGHSIDTAVATCAPDPGCAATNGTLTLTVRGVGGSAPFEYHLTATLRAGPRSGDVSTDAAVALVVLGSAGRACPNLTLPGTGSGDDGVVRIVGDAVIDTTCGHDPIAGDETSLQSDGAVSRVDGVSDPFAELAPPVADCASGAPPGPVGGGAVGSVRTYPDPVELTGTTVFAPGTFVFCNGLAFGEGATVRGSDVTIVLLGGGLSFDDGASVAVTAPDTGAYADLALWLPTGGPVTLDLGDDAAMVDGFIAAPESDVEIRGSASSETSAIGIGGLVARSITVSAATVRVGAGLPTSTISSHDLDGLRVGEPAGAASFEISGGDAPQRWSAQGLPDGLDIDPASGVLSGTPSEAGLFDVTVAVVDSTDAVATHRSTVYVRDALSIATPGTLPVAQVGMPYQPMLAAASGGTAPFAWTATGLPTGLTIDSAAGRIDGTPLDAGSFPVTLEVRDATGATSTRVLVVAVAPALSIATSTIPEAEVGSPYPTTPLTASGGAGGLVWTGFGLPDGLTMDTDGRISGTAMHAGPVRIVVLAEDSAGATAVASYAIAVVEPSASGVTVLPAAETGIGYGPVALAEPAGTAPYAWSAGGLPDGIVLDPATGVLSGVPVAAGIASIDVTVVDAAASTTTSSASITVETAPTIDVPTSVATLRAGTPMRPVPMFTRGGLGPFTWSAVGLPDGVTIDAATGVVSGTPTAGGATSVDVTITVTDSVAGSAAATYPLAVTEPLAVSTVDLGPVVIGDAYSTTVEAAGGTGPYSWTASGLPPGVSMDPSGAISGSPASPGDFSVLARVTDAGGATAARALTLTVLVRPAGCPDSVTGWRGEYFADDSFTAPPTSCRDDADVGFGAAGESPSAVRWTRDQSFAAGDYVFSVAAAGGVRLFVDGSLVLDRWSGAASPSAFETVARSLSAGRHRIVLEHRTTSGDASVRLFWARQ